MLAVSAAFPNTLRVGLVVTAVWALVALMFASQGYGIARYRGTPQPWWPSLGYAVAIFSIWAALTPIIVRSVRRAARLGPLGRLFAFAAGLPVTGALHVVLFALVYWPVYNGDGRVPTRRAMVEHMAVRNFDTNALLYILVVCCALWLEIRTRRAAASASPKLAQPEPELRPEPASVRVRSRGRLQIFQPAEIDWVAAAGDYVELHVGGDVHLADGSLAALERILPAGEFARIHRAVLVRVDRVAEVRGLGRGDALLRLTTGAELRLSRRYRPNLAALLQSSGDGDPARPLARSRSPNTAGGTG